MSHFLFLEEYSPLDNDKLLSVQASIPQVSMIMVGLVLRVLNIEQLSEEIKEGRIFIKNKKK
jgi:uncharacterized membrane protein